jgi:hypothetical protein
LLENIGKVKLVKVGDQMGHREWILVIF